MVIRWESFELDLPARRLRDGDNDVHLEPQVFDVLALLVENRDRVVSKGELLDEVWGDQFVSESALTTRIKTARRALGDDGRTQRFIRNVHGRGYQFVGDVDERGSVAASPDRGASGAVGEPPVVVPLATTIAVDDEYPFVGRRDEIESIERFAAARSGSTQVFIGGPPGLGKSRLAIEMLERAASRGAIVCAGRCDEHLTSTLQPVRDALTQLATAAPSRFAHWAKGIEGPVVHLMPSVSSLFDALPVAVDGYSGIDSLLNVLERAAADAPVQLLIDDLQWSDEPTRTFLAQLHRRFGHREIVTTTTFRSGTDDLPGSVRQWIAAQTRLPSALRIDLDELDRQSSVDLIEAVLGQASESTADLLERTGGHTLFLTESLRDQKLGNTSADSVSELVTSRLDRLDDHVQRIIQAGALIGPEFGFDIAAQVAELDLNDAIDAIDRAVDAEFLHETISPSRFRFSHQLVPEAVGSVLSRLTRARLHQRCAAALTECDSDEVEVAFHLLGAVPLVQVEDAVGRGVHAAADAAAAKQFDRAIRLLERCLAVGPQTRQRAEVLIAIGESHVASGMTAAGVSYFDDAADLARHNGWVDVLAAAALGRFGRSPYRKPGERVTLDLLEEALAALGDEPSPLRARVMAKIAAFSVFTGTLAERGEMTQAALDMAVDATATERMELLESRAIVFSCPAGVDELERIDAELAELREETDVYFADAAAPETAHLMRGNGESLRQVARLDELRARAQPIAEWRDLVLRSTLAGFAGDVDGARLLCDQAADIGEAFWGESSTVLHAFGHLFLDCLAEDFGRSAELFGVLSSFSSSPIFAIPCMWSQAELGRVDEARSLADDVRVDSFRWFGEHILGGNVLVALAEAAMLIDDDRLCRLAEDSLAPFGDLVLGVPWACSLAAADSLSRLAERRGDDQAARAHRATAVRLYERLDAPALLNRVR